MVKLRANPCRRIPKDPPRRLQATFVIGLPQNQTQRQRNRDIIKSHASRQRWKHHTPAESSTTPRHNRSRRTAYDKFVASKQTHNVPSAGSDDPLPGSYIDELPEIGFSQSIDLISLPPALPLESELERPRSLTNIKVFEILHKIRNVHSHAFHLDPDGLESYNIAWMRQIVTVSFEPALKSKAQEHPRISIVPQNIQHSWFASNIE